MPTAQTLERFIARVESNAHVAAIEEFYTESATMRENTKPARGPRSALADNEARVLARAKSVEDRLFRVGLTMEWRGAGDTLYQDALARLERDATAASDSPAPH